MNNKAVIYCRVSTADQGRGYSLPTQRAACENYASRDGLEVIAVLNDEETGFTMERAGLETALNLLRRGSASHLIVYTIDRLNRNFVQSVLTREEIKQMGAALHLVVRDVTTSEDTMLLDNVEAIMAHHEVEVFKERTDRGRKAKAESGRIMASGRAPFGFVRVGSGRSAQWVVQPEDAETVRRIFHLYTNEYRSACEIAQQLQIEGRLSPVGRDPSFAKRPGSVAWRTDTIKHILKNPIYSGVSIQTVGGKTYHQTVPAILDEALWNASKQRRAERRWRRPTRNAYLLSGRIRCTCGYARNGVPIKHPKGGKVRRYYRCIRSLHPELGPLDERCSDTHVPGEPVERLVWNWVVKTLLDPAQISAELERRRQQTGEQQAELEETIARITAQIAERNSQMERLLDLYLDGKMPKDLLDRRRLELEDQLEQFNRARAELVKRAAVVVTNAGIEAVSEFVAKLRAGADLADPEERHRLLSLLRIEVIAGLERSTPGRTGPGIDRLVIKVTSQLSSATLYATRQRGLSWDLGEDEKTPDTYQP